MTRPFVALARKVFRPRPTALLSLALVGAALVQPASSQCLLPDGLSGPCCNPAIPTLPSFPIIATQATGICWDDCALSSQTCMSVSAGAPVPTGACTQYTASLLVENCFGIPAMSGTMTLDYTRTWEEHVFPGGPPLQVWRFAAKVDLLDPGTGVGGCPIPSCMAATGQAFFYGYVDYSLSCVTGAWESALVLYHGCDEFMHRAPFSALPGSYHPNTTYAIVAPDTAANPFVPSLLPPPSGSVLAEAIRTVMPATGTPCMVEEPVVQGLFSPTIFGCLCPLSLTPPQQAGIRTAATSLCGGSFTTLNLWPIVPWYDLTSTSIGRWTTGATYPGPEHASVAEGLFVYETQCNPIGVVEQSFDIFYGSITQEGYFVPPDPVTGIPGSQNFIDLASNYSLPVALPIALPLFGTVAPTKHLIYLNVF